ncbi:hypothetical protein F4823DRAFT_196042 [Ustulina deusta]|nr:hypothetical protein F4823DRAFT_196042 [Ustulina deusta]
MTQLQEMMHVPQRNQNSSVTELATSSTKVASFCQAVLKVLIPREFWGCGLAASHNERQFLKKVVLFISLRRFEDISLYEVSQGMKVSNQNRVITR